MASAPIPDSTEVCVFISSAHRRETQGPTSASPEPSELKITPTRCETRQRLHPREHHTFKGPSYIQGQSQGRVRGGRHHKGLNLNLEKVYMEK